MEPLSGSTLHFFFGKNKRKKKDPDQNVRQGKSDSLVSCQKMDGSNWLLRNITKSFRSPDAKAKRKRSTHLTV